jgi:FSR family fosmidomycin resistance protein-like MFS transporter
MLLSVRRRLSQVSVFVLVLLAIELLDELVFGVREAAWPLIRDDLALSYAQIGLLLAVPDIIASFIEPALGILGDSGKRRIIILSGGVCFAVALLLTGVSHQFIVLTVSFILFYPSSGAFVSLSQAALMDDEPERHEQNMARWTLAGSLGVVLGPLALGAAISLGYGWRDVFLAMALLSFMLVMMARRFSFSNGHAETETPTSFMQGIRNAVKALRRRDVLRWLILLAFSDLMLDTLLGYLALYMGDVARVSEAQAGVAVNDVHGVAALAHGPLAQDLARHQETRAPLRHQLARFGQIEDAAVNTGIEMFAVTVGRRLDDGEHGRGHVWHYKLDAQLCRDPLRK